MSYWKKRLSPRSVMVGKPKGRSIKALRERCDALAGEVSTRAVGINLTNWHEKVLVAKHGGVEQRSL